MPKEFVQKLALYSILPCILAFAAIFLNGLFQPKLQWQVKLLESQGEPTYRIDYLEISTTDLLSLPHMTAYLKEGYGGCGVGVDWVYVENKLFQDKSILQNWVSINNNFASWLVFLSVFNAAISAVYLLKQKTGWLEVFVILLLAAISVIGLITVLGPLGSYDVFCWIQVKAEAQLKTISYDGIIYAFMGAFVAIIAGIVLISRFIFLKFPSNQTKENTP